METKEITQEDLFLNDEELYDRLTRSKNNEITRRLGLLNKSLVVEEDNLNYQLHVRGKIRYVDPKGIKRRTDKTGF